MSLAPPHTPATGEIAFTATRVTVRLAHDTAPRIVTVPPDFAATALAEDPAAQDFFNTLSYSDKRRFVRSVVGARTGETRRRRIAKPVAALREERT